MIDNATIIRKIRAPQSTKIKIVESISSELQEEYNVIFKDNERALFIIAMARYPDDSFFTKALVAFYDNDSNSRKDKTVGVHLSVVDVILYKEGSEVFCGITSADERLNSITSPSSYNIGTQLNTNNVDDIYSIKRTLINSSSEPERLLISKVCNTTNYSICRRDMPPF